MAVHKRGLQCIFTFVYGENWASYRKSLWAELCNISNAYSNMPWSVLGDFNVARFMNEKLSGKSLSIHQLQDFNDCISYCSLSDITSSRSIWSWCNRNDHSTRIFGSLDRILCNHAWIDLLSESNYTYLNHAINDHAPILLQLKAPTNSGPKPFRFYNYWMKCEGFNDFLQSFWTKKFEGYPIFQLICKLKYLKIGLKTWVNDYQHHTPRKQIELVRSKLTNIQQKFFVSPSDVLLQ